MQGEKLPEIDIEEIQGIEQTFGKQLKAIKIGLLGIHINLGIIGVCRQIKIQGCR